MLLSDRDILAAQADGHISLDPWTPIGPFLPFV